MDGGVRRIVGIGKLRQCRRFNYWI